MFRAAALAVLCLSPMAGQDPLAALRRQHPRLIALDEDIARLRELIRSDPGARALYSGLRDEAAKIENAPTVEYKVVGPRLLTQSRRCLLRVYTLGLLYRLDGERRYLDRALEELRAAAAFPDWNPSHFLDTAEMTHAFAIGYDWLYPALNEETRALLRRAIVGKGIDAALPFYRERRGWTLYKHNWNQVCNGGIGIGALAVGDEEPEKAGYVLTNALSSIRLPMAEYEPDGGWAEGPGYWHYATRYNVYFLAALESALGSDFGLGEQKGFRLAGRFRVYFAGPAGLTFNYADASPRVENAPEMFWLARRYSEPVYAWDEHQRLDWKGDPLDLLWYRPESRDPASAGWAPSAVFRAVEVAFLRSAWRDPGATFLAVKGGDNAANHSHLDLGSFVLDAAGARWALDLGGDDYNLPGYFGARRWSYYRLRTESHNTLLIDGQNQAPKASARIVRQRLGERFSEVSIDLREAYAGRLNEWSRRVALDGDEVAVADTFSAPKPVEAVWGMLTDAAVRTEGVRAMLEKPGARLEAAIVSPPGAVFSAAPASAPAPENPNTGVTRLTVRLSGPVARERIVVTFTPVRGEASPRRRNWSRWK